MADIAAFTSPSHLVKGIGVFRSFTATTAVKAGQVVCFHGTGVDWSVIPSIAGSGTYPIGVAVTNADAGKAVDVALNGSIVKVVNADDGTGIEAGEWVKCDDNAVGGTVKVCVYSGGIAAQGVIGHSMEAIAANSSGFILVCPQFPGTSLA